MQEPITEISNLVKAVVSVYSEQLGLEKLSDYSAARLGAVLTGFTLEAAAMIAARDTARSDDARDAYAAELTELRSKFAQNIFSASNLPEDSAEVLLRAIEGHLEAPQNKVSLQQLRQETLGLVSTCKIEGDVLAMANEIAGTSVKYNPVDPGEPISITIPELLMMVGQAMVQDAERTRAVINPDMIDTLQERVIGSSQKTSRAGHHLQRMSGLLNKIKDGNSVTQAEIDTFTRSFEGGNPLDLAVSWYPYITNASLDHVRPLADDMLPHERRFYKIVDSYVPENESAAIAEVLDNASESLEELAGKFRAAAGMARR